MILRPHEGLHSSNRSDDLNEDRYPLAIYKPLSLENLAASVHLKMLKGAMQTAGIAFRLEMPTIITSWPQMHWRTALTSLASRTARSNASAERTPTSPSTIGSARRPGRNDRFSVSLDGTQLFTVSDRTFLKEGRIALWTEEDNVTRFDQLEITALPWSEER